MRTAILVVWWIGLLGALVPTLVILKQSLLVLGTLQDILRLARLTADAARGTAANTVAVSSLQGVGEVLRPVDASLGEVGTALGRVAGRLDDATG
jgi:hypothetical protein